jgi:SET domain-containing protein
LAEKRYKRPESVEIRYSPGKGRGVFATCDIAKGDVIEAAPALTIPKQDIDHVLATFLQCYVFQTDDRRNYVVALGWVSIINDGGRKANCEFFVTRDTLVIKALRRIRAGQEVLANYGWTKAEWARALGKPLVCPPQPGRGPWKSLRIAGSARVE